MKVRRVDFYPDDWLAGTVELDEAERGVYITICALIYSAGGPIAETRLKAYSRSHGNRLNRCLHRLETLGKIIRNGSEIDQKRSENELERSQKRSEKARKNGAKGGRPNGLAKPDGFRDGKAYNQQTTVVTDSESPKEGDSGAVAPVIDPQKAFWDRSKATLIHAGVPKSQVGGLIGRWRQAYGSTAVEAAMDAIERDSPSEPIAFAVGFLCKWKPPSQGKRELWPSVALA